MFGSQIPDKDLQKSVDRQLTRCALGALCRVKALVKNGSVTLSGNLRYEAQRRPVLKAIQSIAGVQRVNDQLQYVKTARTDA